MITELHSRRTELAHRESNGIEVSLFWTAATNRVTVEVVDASLNERFEVIVDPAEALDAFHHPYAYAA
jgi:hypothetical protein